MRGFLSSWTPAFCHMRRKGIPGRAPGVSPAKAAELCCPRSEPKPSESLLSRPFPPLTPIPRSCHKVKKARKIPDLPSLPSVVTPRGIEPLFSDRKSDVLTAGRWGRARKRGVETTISLLRFSAGYGILPQRGGAFKADRDAAPLRDRRPRHSRAVARPGRVIGEGGGIRTHGHNIKNVVLYQAELHPPRVGLMLAQRGDSRKRAAARGRRVHHKGTARQRQGQDGRKRKVHKDTKEDGRARRAKTAGRNDADARRACARGKGAVGLGRQTTDDGRQTTDDGRTTMASSLEQR